MATTNFTTIYDYFWVHCTDEDKKIATSYKAKEYLRAIFADFITYIDDEASIDYTSELITTTDTMTEVEKNLLGLMLYKKHIEIQNVKYGKLFSIISDSHRVTSVDTIKKALREVLNDTEEKINNILATLL